MNPNFPDGLLAQLVEHRRAYIITSLIDQNPGAHWRRRMDMVRQG